VLPSAPLNALIQPDASPWKPKLPMRMAPLNSPKFCVARVTPHGALSLPREAKRLIRTPSVVKTSTKPSPTDYLPEIVIGLTIKPIRVLASGVLGFR
jgi:hypothetical protein